MQPFHHQYPEDLGTAQAGENKMADNWILFSAFDFKATTPKGTIALYIPGGALNTSYKSSYDTPALGGLGAMSDRAISEMSKGGGLGIDALKEVIGAGTAGMVSEGSTVTLLKGAAKFGEEGKALMERAQGAVLNPFLTAAYKGPTDMRGHDFTFQMLPQRVEESKKCLKLVNQFKKSMLPSHAGGDSETAPSMLFGYPDTFTIDFYVNGEELPKSGLNPMFNIGKSVLTSCDLSYDTENVPLFFDGTQYPVSIEMKLSFIEIDVMYREKIDKGM